MSLLTPGPRHAEWAPTRPRYVALDVDGTLVGPDGGVSDAVVEAIAAAQDAGIHAGVATGRPFGGVHRVLARSGLVGPHITFNGGAVVHDGEVARSWSLATDAVAALIEESVARGIHLEVYTGDGYLVTDEDPRRAVHTELLDFAPDGVVRPGDPLPDVIKLAAMVFDDDASPVVELMRAHGLTAEAGSSPAAPGVIFVNATDPAADKGVALTAVAELLGIDGAATMAVGDALNDVSSLRAAGTGVVMGQSTEDEVRAAAHLVAPGVEDDGAAAALHGATSDFDGVDRPGSS